MYIIHSQFFQSHKFVEQPFRKGGQEVVFEVPGGVPRQISGGGEDGRMRNEGITLHSG